MNKFMTLLLVLVIMSLSTIFLPEKIDRLELTLQKKNLTLCMREYAQVKRENTIQTCNDMLCTIDYTSHKVYDKQSECLSLSDRYENKIVQYIYKYDRDFVPYGIYP